MGEFGVDVVHLHQLVVGDVGLRQQHVHVAGHAAGHRMDGEFHVHAAAHEGVEQLADLMLRLGHRQPVARHDDHTGGAFQNGGGLFRAGAAHVALFGFGRCGLQLTEGAEQHIGEGAVHGLAHDDGKDQARGAIQSAGDHQQLIIQCETHGAGRKPGVGVQERNDRGHIGAADGDDQQHAEQQGQPGENGEHPGVRGNQDQPHTQPSGDREQQQVHQILVAVGDAAAGAAPPAACPWPSGCL